MKKIWLLLLIVIFLNSCKSSELSSHIKKETKKHIKENNLSWSKSKCKY